MEPSPVVTTTGSPASAVLRSLETWLSRIEAHAGKTSTSVIAANAEKVRRFMVDSYFDCVKSCKKINIINGLWESLAREKTT